MTYREERESKLQNIQMTPMEAKINILFAKSEIESYEELRESYSSSMREAISYGLNMPGMQREVEKEKELIDRRLTKLREELYEARAVIERGQK